MTTNYYNELCKSTLYEIEMLAFVDIEQQHQDMESSTSAAVAEEAKAVELLTVDSKALMQANVYELYIRYISLTNQLEEVYDNLLQPQKRQTLREILDACLGRIVELKHDLVSIDLSEFSYNDEALEKLKFTPIDIELRIPRYFLRERSKEIEQREQTMHEILVRIGWLEDDDVKEQMTELQAIRLIQMHERARQGRLRAYFMKEIRLLKERNKSEEKDRTQANSSLLAAMKIQKMWRGHADRRKTRRRKLDEMILIGMLPPPASVLKEREEKRKQLTEIVQKRYAVQQTHQEQYSERLQTISVEIREKYAALMGEEFSDEIRAWCKDSYAKTGKIPEFPSEEHGGSLHLFSRPGTESEVSRSSARSSKESRKTKDKLKSPIRSGDLNVIVNPVEGQSQRQPALSICLPLIKSAIDKYNDVWYKKDTGTDEIISDEIIYLDKYNEVEQQVRKTVDEAMREELEVLQAALGKKSKKSNKARKSVKKNKKKKEKDLTPDRTTESLFEELVMNGIIRKYPKVYLNEYLGDKSVTTRSSINPSHGDIRQLLIEFCILPLGSEQIHNNIPNIRSILIAGPKGSGKKTLVHSICSEVGAILFDLTPANIVGKYPGKSGLIMLMHLVLKVSRLLQPAIIFIDDAERMFMKKVPKTDRTDPKRLKKDLPKLVKNIAVEDRVLLIGITKSPWDADQKLLQQTYNRFFYIPRPDYGGLLSAWQQLLHKYSDGLSSLDCSVIAKISDGYTIGAVSDCIKEILTCKRKLQLRSQPLTNVELINVLSLRDPVYLEEEEAFKSWWTKTPLGKARQRLLEQEQKQLLEEQEQSTKQNKDNK